MIPSGAGAIHGVGASIRPGAAAMLRIVIAGGGTAGWMTAAALSRFLPLGPGTDGRPRFSVTLVESEAIGTIGVGEATIPQIRLFNQALGLEEGDFLIATRGSHKLGIEFVGWHGRPYIHAFGPVGRPLAGVAFHHHWARGRAVLPASDQRPLRAVTYNAVVADAGRVDPAAARADPGGVIPPVVHAYQFDAALYAAALRRYAEARGVTRIEGRIAATPRDADGDLAALVLDGTDGTDGGTVAGDLFIDCTGFRALLLNGALGVGYDDWSHLLPCDRALAVPCARVDPVTPFTRATARIAGWQWRIPLQHRTGNGLVYSSAHLSDDAAAALLLANLDAPALADPRPIRFVAGRRRQAWSRNVVGIGLAAGFLEPLESTSIHLIQTAIERLVTMLPAGRVSAAARDAFNRRTADEYIAIRDFLILHYHANDRVGQPFWDAMRHMAIPDTLAQRIALFRDTGQVLREGDELFTEPGWVQVMAGQGIVPTGCHPLADTVPPADLAAYLATLADGYARAAARLPDHGAHLDALATRTTDGPARPAMARG